MKLELPSLYLECEQVAPKLWACMQPFPFMIDGELWFIKWHFVCDKYSVPPNPLYPRRRAADVENIPAWLHDYTRRYRNVLGLSVRDTDILFRDAMEMVGLHPWTVRIKYRAVRMFAWATAGKGDGTPPRRVRKFIAKHGWGC
jgi:hypothetical protein